MTSSDETRCNCGKYSMVRPGSVRLPLRTEMARRPFGFRSTTGRKERRIRREFFRQTCRTGTLEFLISFPQSFALLGPRTLFSRRDNFFEIGCGTDFVLVGIGKALR